MIAGLLLAMCPWRYCFPIDFFLCHKVDVCFCWMKKKFYHIIPSQTSVQNGNLASLEKGTHACYLLCLNLFLLQACLSDWIRNWKKHVTYPLIFNQFSLLHTGRTGWRRWRAGGSNHFGPGQKGSHRLRQWHTMRRRRKCWWMSSHSMPDQSNDNCPKKFTVEPCILDQIDYLWGLAVP